MIERVYVLYLVKETYDEISEVIYGVFATREKADNKGKELVSIENNEYISHMVVDYAFFY